MIHFKNPITKLGSHKEISVVIVCFLTAWAYLTYKTIQIKIFADDAGFIKAFSADGFRGLAESLVNYVPGRNLHILWQDLFFAATSYQSDDFWKYRILHTLIYSLNGMLLSFIIAKLYGRLFIGLAFGLAALFFPMYSDVIWWASALPMHVFSTTLILFMIVVSISIEKRIIRLLMINTIGVLAVFTYDQAAAAVFAFLAYECFGYYKVSKRLRKNERIYLTTQASILITFLAIYIKLLSSRNGNGPGLSLDVFHRLTQNFLFLPLNVFVQHPVVFLIIFIAVIFTLIVILRNHTANLSNLRQVFEISNAKYLWVSLASYFPIAIWYVSPRHTYLPILFFLVWLSQLFSRKNCQNLDIRRFWLPVGLLISILAYTTTLSLDDAKVESQYRSKVYSLINNSLGEYEKSEICILISPQAGNIQTFQHEYFNAALSFYSGNPHFIQYDCVDPHILFDIKSSECLKNEVLKDLIFLRYFEDSTSTRLDPSFSSVSQCGIL